MLLMLALLYTLHLRLSDGQLEQPASDVYSHPNYMFVSGHQLLHIPL